MHIYLILCFFSRLIAFLVTNRLNTQSNCCRPVWCLLGVFCWEPKRSKFAKWKSTVLPKSQRTNPWALWSQPDYANDLFWAYMCIPVFVCDLKSLFSDYKHRLFLRSLSLDIVLFSQIPIPATNPSTPSPRPWSPRRRPRPHLQSPRRSDTTPGWGLVCGWCPTKQRVDKQKRNKIGVICLQICK